MLVCVRTQSVEKLAVFEVRVRARVRIRFRFRFRFRTSIRVDADQEHIFHSSPLRSVRRLKEPKHRYDRPR